MPLKIDSIQWLRIVPNRNQPRRIRTILVSGSQAKTIGGVGGLERRPSRRKVSGVAVRIRETKRAEWPPDTRLY